MDTGIHQIPWKTYLRQSMVGAPPEGARLKAVRRSCMVRRQCRTHPCLVHFALAHQKSVPFYSKQMVAPIITEYRSFYLF